LHTGNTTTTPVFDNFSNLFSQVKYNQSVMNF
jgi:hypothetical protein